MKTDAKLLRTALELLRPIVKGRTLPILACFRLEAKQDKLTIVASDIDQFQSESVKCDGGLTALCVNANHLFGCIPAEGAIHLKSDGKQLEIKHGKDVFKLNILGADEFPELPSLKDLKLQGVVCKDLAEGISSVAWSAHTDDERYVLKSVHVLSKPKMLLCEASDGGNGAFFERPLIGPDLEFLIPSDFSVRFRDALLRDGAELRVSDKAAFVKHDAGDYWVKQLEAVYPNTAPMRTGKLGKLDKLGELEIKPAIAALDSCIALCDPSKTPAGLLEFDKDGLEIALVSLGTASLTIPGKFVKHTAKVNVERWRRCLRGLGGEKCQIFIGHEGNALAMRAGDVLVLSMNLRE